MNNRDKILKISKDLGLSHIGSCLSVLPILEDIYSKKKPEDKVILDNAHAHLSHLLFLNKGHISLVSKEIELWGIHCDRWAGCDATGGSLGHGIGIGIGYAIANPDKTINVIVSDGSMMEGSNWEALRIASELKINNLDIYANLNGYTAVSKIDTQKLGSRLKSFFPGIHIRLTDNDKFGGVEAHYIKL